MSDEHKELRHDRELGAAILGMTAAIELLRRNGIDPVATCKFLNDDGKVEKVIGRKPYDLHKGTTP